MPILYHNEINTNPKILLKPPSENPDTVLTKTLNPKPYNVHF